MERADLMDVLTMVKDDRISVEEGLRLINSLNFKKNEKIRKTLYKGSDFGLSGHPKVASEFLKTACTNRNLW